MSNKKSTKIIRFLIIFLIIVLCGAGFIVYTMLKNSGSVQSVSTCKIEKRDIQVLISATGTLNAKGTVEIGTQVSGTISKVYFKYNDSVKKGDLLAVLDTKLLEIAVKQAEADMLKVQASYDLHMLDHQNKSNLSKNNLISNYEFEQSKVEVASSYAQLLSAKANLDKAQTNLQYAYIRSPINGTILDVSVEEGQTVSASTSAPTLFIVAENLDNMEIHANVDESDIGKIKINQQVNFTIESNDSIVFHGKVREVRLNPKTTSNVVNYTVVIDAKNYKDILLPGMTATIDFVVEEAKDVYAIQNSALKVQPTAKMMEIMKKNPPKPPEGFHPGPNGEFPPRDTAKNGDFPPPPDMAKNGDKDAPKPNGGNMESQHSPRERKPLPDNVSRQKKERRRPTMLWKEVAPDEYEIVPVRTGITDGVYTQLLNIDESLINDNFVCNIVTKGKKPAGKKPAGGMGGPGGIGGRGGMGGPPMMR